jgi:uncharacterized protein (DUF58 family)
MKIFHRVANWLESRWVAPAYSGWLLTGLALFFFMAATNTLAGWLYVVSGISFALLAIAAILPERSLRQIRVFRNPIQPVSVGDHLTIEVVLENRSKQPKTLLQVRDVLPYLLGQPVTQSIETIPANDTYRWIYYQPTQRRGVYRWQAVQLRTAAPLGLFWCRRSQDVATRAVVYPTVLSLAPCPIVDEMGQMTSLQLQSDRRTHAATEGITRSLRPYRWGDPTRLVHWRTSARYSELRVRELEVLTGGQELVICLDSALLWRNPSDTSTQSAEDFEQAVIAAASLYFYACHRHLNVQLWTAGTGSLHSGQVVLETLAAIQSGEAVYATHLPDVPLVWLTQNPLALSTLPPGSRWLLWPTHGTNWQAAVQAAIHDRNLPGLVINRDRPLQDQLQSRSSWF